MIQNSTADDRTTAVVESKSTNYDDTGAMIYIIIVLLWYSIGIIFMLGMQMRARTEGIEGSARRRTKLLIRNLRDQTHTKEILEELVDKKKRARLWDIYLGTKIQTKDKLTRAETVRIRHIEKQLATINRNRRFTNETLFPAEDDIHYYRSHSDSRQITRELSTVEIPETLHHRRRSSLDQQTLERWKALANQSKIHEQMPWTIRKLMVRRYFRHHLKKPLSIIHQDSTITNPTTDNLLSFTEHINILTRHRTESDLNQISTCPERHNPYLTYFYTSSDYPNILTTDFFPVSSDHSIE